MLFVTVTTIGVFDTVPRTFQCCLTSNALFQDLVDQVAQDYPEWEHVFCSTQAQGVVILRNGQSLYLQNGFKTPLKNGDDIFIAPMTHGG